MEGGDPERALAVTRALLKARPGHPLTEGMLGLCLFALGDTDQALKLFEGLLRRNPDQVPLRFNAGLCALREDDEHRAMAHLQRVVALSPGHRRALALLALLNLRHGQRYVARDMLDRAGLQDLATQVNDATEAEMVLNLTLELEEKSLTLYAPDEAHPRPHEGFAEIGAPAPEGETTGEWETTPLQGIEDTLPAPSRPWRDTGPPPGHDPRTLAAWPPPEQLWDQGENTRPMPLGAPPPPTQPGEAPISLDMPEEPPVPRADPDLPAPGAAQDTAPAEARTGDAPAASLAGPHPQDLVGLVGEEGPEVEHRLGWLVVRLGALVEGGATDQGIIARGARQVLRLGKLAVRPSTPEGWGEQGGGPTDMVQVTGDGMVALDPDPGATLVLLQLEGEVCRVQCDALLSCSGALIRRMDRLVPERGDPLPLFHLDGAGFLALRWPAPVQGFRVTPDNPLALRPQYLVAWLGPLRARLTGEPGDGVPSMINLTGTGLALVGASPG